MAVKNWLISKEIHEFREFVKHSRKIWSSKRKDLVKEHNLEKSLGIETAGEYHPLDDTSRHKDMKYYGPTGYGFLEQLRDSLKMTPEDVFVDFGAGKGRVVCFFAGERIKKLVGVEMDPVMLEAARQNIDRLKVKNSPIELVPCDAAAYDVGEGTVFFFYYPFEYKTFNQVLQNIRKSLAVHPRTVRIVYVCCPQRERWILGMQRDWLEKELDGYFLIYRSIAPARP